MSFHSKPTYQKLFISCVIWPIEAAILYLIIGVMRLMPRRIASAVMGWILRSIGPKTRWQSRSREHLLFALPHLTLDEANAILHDMWDNIGRNVGEYFHVNSLMSSPDLTISGLEHLDREKGGFLITGHFGNWELAPLLLRMSKNPSGLIYRPTNNPIVSRVFKARISANKVEIFEKGRGGAVGMLQVIKRGGLMLLLSDQTLREGDQAPFFGQDVPTANSHIKLAAKTGLPIYMLRSQRVKGAQHLMKIYPPIYIEKNPSPEAIAAYTDDMNKMFESWIKDAPAQWLWPHRRWGKNPKRISK